LSSKIALGTLLLVGGVSDVVVLLPLAADFVAARPDPVGTVLVGMDEHGRLARGHGDHPNDKALGVGVGVVPEHAR
jgi:hypothetical protein